MLSLKLMNHFFCYLLLISSLNNSVGETSSIKSDMSIIFEEDNQVKGALFLGNKKAAMNSTELKKQGVNAVVTVAGEFEISYNGSDILHKVYPALDRGDYDLSIYFEDSFNFIEEALKNGSVLVHCSGEISRSATIVIAYLMKKNNWKVDKTYTFVKKKIFIHPNPGFIKQLRSYQSKLEIYRESKVRKDEF